MYTQKKIKDCFSFVFLIYLCILNINIDGIYKSIPIYVEMNMNSEKTIRFQIDPYDRLCKYISLYKHLSVLFQTLILSMLIDWCIRAYIAADAVVAMHRWFEHVWYKLKQTERTKWKSSEIHRRVCVGPFISKSHFIFIKFIIFNGKD